MIFTRKYLRIFILIFINFTKYSICFNVNFRAVYDAKVEPFNTQIYKREMTQFFDKASYSFNGFKTIESIPVLFPIDICMLNLAGVKYATTLHRNPNGVIHFTVFKSNNGSYIEFATVEAPKAIDMDCIAYGDKGYIAIVFNLSTPVEDAREGSPVYELNSERLRPIQYFAAANLEKVYIRVHGNDIFLSQTFKNTYSAPNLFCPYFRWSGSTFNPLGRIPCSNARHVEPFFVDYELYVAVANYADQRGRTSTYSEIHKFVRETRKFQLFQKIKTNGAVDVRYFGVPVDEVRYQHFLVFGNSISSGENDIDTERAKREGKNLEADSIIYVFDKGQFVPYQRLTFYAVKQFLPIQNSDAEKFLLLVSSSNQDLKIYNLNDWKFEESNAQFTAGALGRGVSRMRIYQEDDNSYLVIANELMPANETSIFVPIFKQEEHANALRQEIIEWTKANIERLKRNDAEQLKREVEQKLKQQQTLQAQQQQQQMQFNNSFTDIPNANIRTVVTESVIQPHLHMYSNYWKALSYANQALNALELQQTSPHQLLKREIHTADSTETEYEFERINVGTLTVRNKLAAQYVNSIAVEEPTFENISAKQTIVTGQYVAPVPIVGQPALPNETRAAESVKVNVDNLLIHGKLNDHTWTQLLNGTLKREGFQFIKTSVTIANLMAASLTVSNNEINEKKLLALVPITGGSYKVNQNVHFDAIVHANALIINKRLNYIPIQHQKFDLLIKRSSQTQVVQGPKVIPNVKVLDKVKISGKMWSDHMRSISPSKAIHEQLVLQGDYTINGNVSIVQTLNALDLHDTNANTSVKTTLTNGLYLDQTLEDVCLIFEAPVQSRNMLVSFINAVDMQQLVSTNTNATEVITGNKMFKNGLSIEHGLSAVKILNGIDVESLEERLLSKHTNQTIAVPMHFGKMIIRKVQTKNVTLGNQNPFAYFTKSGDQYVNGKVKVKTLETEHLLATNLNTNGQIFQQALMDIYQQKPKSSSLKLTGGKFNGTVFVKSLKLKEFNGKPVGKLERQLAQLRGNIKYVGSYKFNHDMNVANLSFHGRLNGVAANDLGKCWLEKSGAQVFSAPQTLAGAEFQNGLQLKGKLNGHYLQDFFEQTYWITRNEFMNKVIFQNPIELLPVIQTRTINKLHVPQDMLYTSSSHPQMLPSNFFVHGVLQINGKLLNTSVLNNLDLTLLNLTLSAPYADSELYLQHANFSVAPHYHTLNYYNPREILNAVWLANENVELVHQVKIGNESFFEGLLEMQGPLNGLNLVKLNQHYFSKSRPQTITSKIVFLKQVSFEMDMHTNEMRLHGNLIERKGKTSFNFNDFAANSLKTVGYHEVRNNWILLEAVVDDLNDVTVNNLNFATDVVRIDTPRYISAEKYILKAKIAKLYTKSGTINEVDISTWLRDAAYFNRSTIYGTTIVDNVNLVGDFRVSGSVNNVKFDKSNVWLRDHLQTVEGNVTIRNKFPTEHRILANNIVRLNAERINGLQIFNFLLQSARQSGDTEGVTDQRAHVHSHLVFEQPVYVAEYSSGDPGAILKSKRYMAAFSKGVARKANMAISSATQTYRFLFTPVKDAVLHTDWLKVQHLPDRAQKLALIAVQNKTINIIGLLDEADNPIKYYRWNSEIQAFVPDTELTWLPQDHATLQLIELIYDSVDYWGEQPLKVFSEVLAENQPIELLRLEGKVCLVKKLPKVIQFHCIKKIAVSNSLPEVSSVLELEHKNVVKQILSMNTRIAILTEGSVEIWNIGRKLKLEQRILEVSPIKQMAVGTLESGETFLALITDDKTESLYRSSVEIYKAAPDKGFKHQQTLQCAEPKQVEFAYIKASNDLLLFVLTKAEPIVVFHHKGVQNFQKIVGESILDRPQSIQTFHLPGDKHFIALLSKDNVTLVQIILNKL